MKIKIIAVMILAFVAGLFFSGKALADCSEGYCAPNCQNDEKPTAETCLYSVGGEINQEGSCCIKKSGADLTSGKVCKEDKGMVAGRCYVSGSGGGLLSMGCSGIGPGLALGTKGEMGCPSDQICCKTQEYQNATQGKPETSSASPTSPATSSTTSPASSQAPVRDPGGLVPCDQNCTLCHIVIGFKKIFDWLMGLLFVTTMLVVTISGVFYMVSTGSKGMMDKAKKALTYGLTAFVIGMGCWLLINIIMTMVGFQNPAGGNWWEFTCDTTQTQGATPTMISTGTGTGGGGGTGTATDKGGGISGKGRDIQVPQDGSKLAQNLEKYKGTVYVFGADKYNSDGTLVTDCSGFTQKIWKDTYGVDIPRYSGAQGNTAFNASSLVNGTILESNGHVGIYHNGSVYHNSGDKKDVKVVELNRYLSGHRVTEMRIPPV